MGYRCVATSVAGFVQQLAVCYVGRGYYFYVRGGIPAHKDPAAIDRKLVERYGIAVSKWTRCRRRKRGQASLQYLRHGDFFVLLATNGEHPVIASEGRLVRDIRRQPLRFMGYAIGCRPARGGGPLHPSVRIERREFAALKTHLRQMAVHRSVEDLGRILRSLPYEPYAPVRDQLRILLRSLNRRRKAAGLEPVPLAVLRQRRRPVRPFAPRSSEPLEEILNLSCPERAGPSDCIPERTFFRSDSNERHTEQEPEPAQEADPEGREPDSFSEAGSDETGFGPTPGGPGGHD
jgi:hypothetical protein